MKTFSPIWSNYVVYFYEIDHSKQIKKSLEIELRTLPSIFPILTPSLPKDMKTFDLRRSIITISVYFVFTNNVINTLYRILSFIFIPEGGGLTVW